MGEVTLATVIDAVPGGPRRVVGDTTTLVTSVTHESRSVEPGGLFCCVVGARSDGHDFAADAVDRGASALLVEHEVPLSVPQVIVADSRAAMGPVASAVWGNPSHALHVVGVTGTNGKTTVVTLLRQIVDHAGGRCNARRRLRHRGDGGVLACARPASRRRNRLRGRRLHEPRGRPPRLPRHGRGVLRSEGEALRSSACSGRGGQRGRCARPTPTRRVDGRGDPVLRRLAGAGPCRTRRYSAAVAWSRCGPAVAGAVQRVERPRCRRGGGRADSSPFVPDSRSRCWSTMHTPRTHSKRC